MLTVAQYTHHPRSSPQETDPQGTIEEETTLQLYDEDSKSDRKDILIQKFLKDSLSTHDSKEALRKANFLANKNQGKNADQGFVLSSLFSQKL